MYDRIERPLRWLLNLVIVGGLVTVVAEHGFRLSPSVAAINHTAQFAVLWSFLELSLIRLVLMPQRWHYIRSHKVFLQDFVSRQHFGEISSTVGRIVTCTLGIEVLGVLSLYQAWGQMLPEPTERVCTQFFTPCRPFATLDFPPSAPTSPAPRVPWSPASTSRSRLTNRRVFEDDAKSFYI